MSITKELFGKLSDGREAYIYTLKNENGMTVKLSEYGAAIVQLFAPDRNGTFTDVVCGYDNLSSYELGDGAQGSVVGRWANRIAKGKFTLDGKEYSLLINNGQNHLHGGKQNFVRALWKSEPIDGDEPALVLTHFSPDGEEGYPGNMNVTVTYTLTKDNSLSINYKATSDKRTVINLTNHCYFNMGGYASGSVRDQILWVDADTFLETDEGLIPTGRMLKVKDKLSAEISIPATVLLNWRADTIIALTLSAVRQKSPCSERVSTLRKTAGKCRSSQISPAFRCILRIL